MTPTKIDPVLLSAEDLRLRDAAQDLRYLLGRGYPRPGALTFVGNRFQLPREDREILNRGVYPSDEAEPRKKKLNPISAIQGRSVGIDGYNVLITLESAILGRTMVLSDDGLVRDTAGAFRSYRPTDATQEALTLLLNGLTQWGAGAMVVLLDAPMSMSGELAAQINAELGGRAIMGRARIAAAVDAELKDFGGLVATSDSVVIDMAAEPLDLAGHLIRTFLPETPFCFLGPDE